MKAVVSDDLRTRLGLGKLQTYTLASDTAAIDALSAIEADLRTVLTTDTYSDVFLLDDHDKASELVRLKLTAGFVTDGSVEVGTGSDVATAQADDSLTDYVTIDYTKGTVVLVDQAPYRYISVRYTAGFDAKADPDTDVIDLDTAPQWLQQAAMAKSIALLSDHPELKNKDGKVVDGKAWETQYWRLVEGKIRYLPGTIRPIM